MATYKSHFNTTNSSRAENPDPQRTTSTTRLPTRKHNQNQTQSNAPIHHSPSKLTKKRPGQSADNTNSSRGAHTQKGGIPRAAGKDVRKQATAATAITASEAAQAKPTIPAPSSRIARFDTPFARTPSLVSGSSASTIESPKSNVLRRKPSNIGRTASKIRKESLESHEDTAVMETLNALSDPFPDSLLGIAMPQTSMSMGKETFFTAEPFSVGGNYVPPTLATVDLPPPTPLYTLSATPSTGYSGSPGPFSLASTPTSMSSFSPGTTVTSKGTSRMIQPSPTRSRPPVTRRRTSDVEEKGLSAVRESSSSSSASTVRNGEGSRKTDKARVDHMPALPPSPPTRPRTSYDRKAEAVAVGARPNTAIPPPELAHLMDAKPIQRLPITTKPVRPSREGTPDYIGLRDPSPVIQSNLSSLPASFHKRQTSAESRGTGVSSTSTSSKTRFPPPAKLSSRNPSPSPSQLSTFSPTSSRTPVTRGTTPEIPSDTEKKLKKGVVPPPSPSKSGSRFGFFRRKTDPVPSAVPAEKRSRKGPAAGTGHEGYGKYGPSRGRSGSTTSGTSSDDEGRSPSAESETGSASRRVGSRKSSVGSKGSPDMDDFFRDRLAPVTLRGEGAASQESRPDLERARTADTSLPSQHRQRHRTEAAVSRSVAIPAMQQQLPVLRPTVSEQSARSQSPVKREPSAPPTTQSQSSSRFGLKSLGGRRLSRMSLTLEGKMAPTSSASSNVSSVAPSPQVNSSKTWQPSAPSDRSMKVEPTPRSATQPTPKPQGKLTRKWNFFQRAHTSPKKDVVPAIAAAPALQYQPSMRSMAHYAIMDGSPKVNMDELEQIMQEANESPDEQEPQQLEPRPETDLGIQLLPEGDVDPDIELLPEEPLREEREEQNMLRPLHGRSMLLPERPFLPPALHQSARSDSPVVQLRRQSPEPYVVSQADQESPILTTVLDSPEPVERPQTSPLVPMPPQRPPRLQQVGRIPHVKRDRERKLSVHSFSRPFGNEGSPALQQQSPPLGSYSPEPEEQALSQPPPLNDMVAQLRLPSHSFADEVQAALSLKRASTQTTTTIDPTAMDGAAEFLAFPPRHDSDISASTSSGHPSFKTLLATAPPVAPLNPMEDEVWREYDDLIDDVLAIRSTRDMKTARSHGSSLGAPFQYPNVTPLNLSSQYRRPSNGTISSGHNSTSTRFLPSLPPAPNSPFSISDFLAAYGDRGVSMATIDANGARLSMPPAARNSNGSGRNSFPSSAGPSSQPSSSQPTTESATATSRPTTMSSSPSTSLKRNQFHASASTATPGKAESEETNSPLDEDDGLESMANLRFGALMTSKWLSFGRVLFSPAHFDLKDPKEDRVLIVDGLGKDWSYYVALTYPQAAVYSLGPDPSAFPSTNPNSSNGPFQSMPNHRHIHHPMLSAPFPFPKGFFAAVVFRFPAVSPESTYRTAISECKRVLRPGGYLEISVLDMDLVNMGNSARKAVRGLKMRMAERSSDLCLRPVSDVLMRLLGRRGFEGMQRCIVGVPAAGPVKKSGDLAAMPAPQELPEARNGLQPQLGDGPTKTTLSFADLLRTDQDNAADSSNITRMVARVGRWWYERCYESAILAADEASGGYGGSIWRDEVLLRECEKRGTTFRLLICYAQKPSVAVRRTVSV